MRIIIVKYACCSWNALACAPLTVQSSDQTNPSETLKVASAPSQSWRELIEKCVKLTDGYRKMTPNILFTLANSHLAHSARSSAWKPRLPIHELRSHWRTQLSVTDLPVLRVLRVWTGCFRVLSELNPLRNEGLSQLTKIFSKNVSSCYHYNNVSEISNTR